MDYNILEKILDYILEPSYVSKLRIYFNIPYDKKQENNLVSKIFQKRRQIKEKLKAFSILYVHYLEDKHFSYNCLHCKIPLENYHQFSFVFDKSFHCLSFCNDCYKNILYTYYKNHHFYPEFKDKFFITSILSKEELDHINKIYFPKYYISYRNDIYKFLN